MKNIKFKTKFDDCKTLREILDKIDDNFFQKMSLILFNIWILYPLCMMLITYYETNDIARDIMYYVLILMGSGGLIIGTFYLLKKYYKNQKFDIRENLPYLLGLILLLWLTFTSLFSINYRLSFTGEWYRKEGLETYLLYGGTFILGTMLTNKQYINILFNNLLIVEVIMAIISLIDNSFTFSLMNNQESYTGIFSQFNHYGYYLMFGIIISIFLFLNKKNKLKYLYLIIYGFLLYALIMNDTFGCYLAVLITIILVIIYQIFMKKNFKKNILIILIFTFISIFTYRYNQNVVYKNFKGLFVDAEVVSDTLKNKKIKKEKKFIYMDNIGTSRGILWRYGLKYIKESPVTGYGLEIIKIKYHEDNINQSRPHNILIQFGVASGIPGIILYISFILVILYRSIKKIKILNETIICILFIVICYLISSRFGHSMFYTTPYFIIFLGILASNTFYKKIA